MASELAFVPGNASHPNIPLGRYLPPVPAGMAVGWIKGHASPGDWILDPLHSTPQLALEAARAGFRVLVASNNPILTFVLETLAQAPARGEFLAALAELGSARRGDERLELHFRSLYQSECASCHQPLQPQAFLWRKGELQPYGRLYHCAHCGDEGERPVTSADLERLNLPGNPNLHLARAIERIALPGDPLREQAQEIAQFFLPRSLYFLTTLINRIEGLSLPDSRRRLLIALALCACDDANSLWPYPDARSRPRQLTIPPVFRENNLWQALEAGIDDWCRDDSPVPLTQWPARPPSSGGICLYPGRLKALLPLPADLPVKAVVTYLPRPNQALWTLSAVWSGWLWGREAVAPLRTALERQRYDWHWHSQALRSVLALISQLLPAEISTWAVMPECVPGFLSAAVLAAETAGLHLEGLALQEEAELAQFLWRRAPSPRPRPGGRPVEPVLHQAIREHIQRTGEPAPYLSLHAAGLEALARENVFPEGTQELTGDSLTRLQNSFNRVFKTPVFSRYERQPSQNIETGWWWLADAPTGELTLADQVEIELVKWLIKNPGRTLPEIETALCQIFPGLLTPSVDLMRVCLDSYAASLGAPPQMWQVRPSEAPAARRNDLETVKRGLSRLSRKLDYISQGELPVTWIAPNGNPAYCLFPIASAVISKYVFQPQALRPQRCILVVPGSRVNLILHKLRRDPRLAAAMNSGWRIMKFRQLRDMLDQEELAPALFESLLDGDPPRWEEATQLTML